MNKINTQIFDPIDKEEKELMESIEQDEWKLVKNMNGSLTLRKRKL